MANRFFVSPAPHVHSDYSTARLMGDVVIALLPALMVSVRVFGWNVLAITAVSIASCVLLEFLVQKYLVKGPVTVCNLSAVVTGLLLAMNLPANIPLWIVVIGAMTFKSNANVDCSTCNGSGVAFTVQCPDCAGQAPQKAC